MKKYNIQENQSEKLHEMWMLDILCPIGGEGRASIYSCYSSHFSSDGNMLHFLCSTNVYANLYLMYKLITHCWAMWATVIPPLAVVLQLA